MTVKISPLDRPGRRWSAQFRTVDIHLLGCTCAVCEPKAPSVPRFSDASGATLGAMFAGIALATIAVAIHDWATAGPGLGSVFGL
jgi:hypothetical protein